ncbi:unnamed protein product [Paramecium octaurelia]|uniref:Tetratricopeptide repeat protein n=1 Tax=Paramecium octaurelia TaxID=43137 RepID=A0A8S1Y6N3_PAROT|nr:unnamed protein product [Paramecium octaurelia]
MNQDYGAAIIYQNSDDQKDGNQNAQIKLIKQILLYKYSEAVILVDQALQQGPNYSNSQHCKVESLRMHGYYDNAINQDDNAFQERQDLIDVFAMSLIYMKENVIMMLLNQIDQAIIQTDKALQIISIILIHYIAKRSVQECLSNLMKQSFGQVKLCKQIQNIVIHYVSRRFNVT